MRAVAASAAPFFPAAPVSLSAIGLGQGEVSALLLKTLLSKVNASGRELADHVCLPFSIVEPLLAGLKADQHVVYKGSARLSDYVYQLTAAGAEEARQHCRHSSYMARRR